MKAEVNSDRGQKNSVEPRYFGADDGSDSVVVIAGRKVVDAAAARPVVDGRAALAPPDGSGSTPLAGRRGRPVAVSDAAAPRPGRQPVGPDPG